LTRRVVNEALTNSRYAIITTANQGNPQTRRKTDKLEIQELIRRWDSERELFYDDIAHVLQNTEKENLFLLTK